MATSPSIPLPTPSCVAVLSLLLLFHILATTAPTATANYLMLTPGWLLPPAFQIWTLVTAALVETSTLATLLDAMTIYGFFISFEPLWGSLKVLELLLVTNAISFLLAAVSHIVVFAFTQEPDDLFIPFCGFIPGLMAIIVAYKQAYPQATLRLLPIPFVLDPKDAPLTIIVLLTLASLYRLVPFTSIPLAVFGFLVAWTYLRYFQRRDSLRGDPSEAFAFEVFWPSALHPFVKLVAQPIISVAKTCKLCPTETQAYDLSKPSNFHIAMPDLRSADANRRQQRALRDLNSRLQTVVVDKVSRNAANRAKDTPDKPPNSADSVVSPTQQTAAAADHAVGGSNSGGGGGNNDTTTASSS